MTLELSNLHLYLSKESEIRSKIKEVILPRLSLIDTDSLELPVLDGYINEFLDDPVLSEYKRQTRYAIIDYLLVEFYNHNRFDLIVQFLLDKFRSYIVIHELAALSWGDKLLEPEEIFNILEDQQLSQKHFYHILNEMSVSYPEQTLNYTKKAISEERIKATILDKLQKKMLKDREDDKILSKGVIPQMNRQEILNLIE